MRTTYHSRLRNTRRRRRGNILTLSAFVLVGMLGVMALAVDLGVLFVARDELQRSADSAALAAAWELIDFDAPLNPKPVSLRTKSAALRANQFAAVNIVLDESPKVAEEDVKIGYFANPQDPLGMLVLGGPQIPNATQVTVRRTAALNSPVPTFFARVFGQQSMSADASATAAVLYSFRGFRAPSDGSNLMMLPFALDEETWDAMLAGDGTDVWRWEAATKKVVAGSDGIREVNLYPQGTGSPGNRGTVDIGANNNSTKDIARQIVHGISKADLAHHGGKLEFNEQGKLFLNADTGISAGVKDELDSIKGQPRIIPIFRSISGNGNTANYTIVKFAGVRILEVDLTGAMNQKRVIVQPASIITRGGIPTQEPEKSYFIYSPAWLIR